MSNSLFMDESNGNGLFASKSNNINNMAAATSTTVGNCNNSGSTLPTSISNEDLSQSLSEYTDADESISAPTEFLAEFLSSVMQKDYKKALKYCKLILQYEPNNATAKEFYPLIQEKLKEETQSDDSDENYNKSSSLELILAQMSDHSGESDEGSCDSSNHQNQQDCDDFGENSSGENISSRRSSSRSSGLVVESISDSDDAISSGDDLLMDDNNICDVGGADGSAANELNNLSRNSSSGGADSRSRSDNTTHSYSSLLLEEEDDIVPTSLHFNKNLSSPDLDISNGNKIHSTSCSDSESPTEPLTQRLAAILRSGISIKKCESK